MNARILWLCFFSLIWHTSYGQIIINEVVSNNQSGIQHHLGENADWLEIYNEGDDSVDLSTYYLSDDVEIPEKWTFPMSLVIKPKEYLIIWATEGEVPSTQNEIHANLGISKRGETLYLSTADQGLIQTVDVPKLLEDQSYGFVRLGQPYVTFNSPTPGLLNDTSSIDLQTNIVIDMESTIGIPEYTAVPLKHTDSCTAILYSFDGSKPHIELKTDEDIMLTKKERSPYFSLIPTRSEYRIPTAVPRFTHLRVRCLDQSKKGYSEDATTIVFDTSSLRKHKLPVLFIDAKEEDFFSAEDGIYVDGEDVNYEKNGKAWKKRISWTFLENGQVKELGTALSEIHGHATRALPQKSLKLSEIENATYQSNDIRHIVQGEQIEKFVARSFHSELIRNEFTDFGFRDDIIMEALDESNRVFGQKRRIAVVYINGEYWGLHSVRETSNEALIHRYTQIAPERIQIKKGAFHVYEFYEEIKDWDHLDSTSFERLSDMFDMDNLVDYTLLQLWGNNRDWPFNNIKTWKIKDSISPARFILFDLDATLKNPNQGIFNLFSPDQIPSRNNPDHYLFFEKIMSFPQFKERLQRRYLSLKSSSLATGHLIKTARELESSISHEIGRHIDRWHYPRSKSVWEKSLSSIESFILLRNLHFDHEVLESIEVELYPNPAMPGSKIQIDAPSGIYTEYKWLHINGTTQTDWRALNENIDTPIFEGMMILMLKGPLGVSSTLVLLTSGN